MEWSSAYYESANDEKYKFESKNCQTEKRIIFLRLT